MSIATIHKDGLVVGMRSMPGNPYDGHTLFETLEQVAILTDCQPKEVFVDLGYCGVDVQLGTKVYHSKLKRNITQRLRRDIRRRSAIEPAIGHMKIDGGLRRNWLKGKDGDAFQPCCAAAARLAHDPQEAAASFCLDRRPPGGSLGHRDTLAAPLAAGIALILDLFRPAYIAGK